MDMNNVMYMSVQSWFKEQAFYSPQGGVMVLAN